jgi:hypothetical protein
MIRLATVGIIGLGPLLIQQAQAAPTLDTRESRIQALNQALAEMENQYDPQEKMLVTDFHSPGYHTTLKGGKVHRTRRSLTYAAGCLDSMDPRLKQRGFDIIERVIQLQDTDPNSRTYGIWSWFLEEPLDKMAPPDWNWADFCGVQLLQAVLYHRDAFPPALLQQVEQSIYHAAQSIKKRNVGPGYTNIAIMGTYVTMLTADMQDLPELKAYALQRLQRFYDYTLETGSFREYNSPTYTVVALEELGRMHQHFTDPQARQLVDALYRLAWEEMAMHFHAPTQQWAGPHSRSYSTLLRDSTLGFIQTQTSAAVRFDGIGPQGNLEACRLRCPCPEDLEHYFIALPRSRQIARPYSTGERPVIGTTYLAPAFCLGTVNRGDLWNQRRSLVAYWGDRKSPSYLHLRFLHDGYDFSTAQFFSAQHQGQALAGVVLATDGGDTHVSLDRIKGGRFKARDLRLRFELGGRAATLPIQRPRFLNEPVELTFPGVTLQLAIPYAQFDNQTLHWESGRADGKAYYDVVCYHGPEQTFDLASMQQAALAVAISMGDQLSKPGAIDIQAEGQGLRFQWHNLTLELPTQPATTKELHAKARSSNSS